MTTKRDLVRKGTVGFLIGLMDSLNGKRVTVQTNPSQRTGDITVKLEDGVCMRIKLYELETIDERVKRLNQPGPKDLNPKTNHFADPWD